MHVNNAGFNTRLNEICLMTGIILHVENILQLRSSADSSTEPPDGRVPVNDYTHATHKRDANEFLLQPALAALT